METLFKQDHVPARIKMLPVDPVRNIPVPWFVAWIDGKPEFRVADAEKRAAAFVEKRCWVCGDYLGRNVTFVIGPMCGVNRVTSEPGCHLDCAHYAATHCPFLVRPKMDRREGGGLEELDTKEPAGFMIRRNPGCTLLWTTRSWELFDDGRGGVLVKVGEPTMVEWFAEGRPATRAEVEESVRTGLPLLQRVCQDDAERLALAKAAGEVTLLYPKE